MVEMIGMLAVAGVLSIGGVAGYKYAVDKNKANRVLNDVQLSYVSVNAAQNITLNQLTPVSFAPISGYQIFTERLNSQDKMTDIIIVKNVEKGVCNHLTDMVQKTAWQLFSVDAGTNRFMALNECNADMTVAFSWNDIENSTFACQKECPENMMCNVNDECVCVNGYTMGEEGTCQQIVCDYSGGIETQTTQYCCENVGGVWDAVATPFCSCPDGYYFNGTMCLMKDWCSYKFTVPEMVQTYQSDCAYDFTAPELVQVYQSDCSYNFTVMETDGKITTTMTQD